MRALWAGREGLSFPPALPVGVMAVAALGWSILLGYAPTGEAFAFCLAPRPNLSGLALDTARLAVRDLSFATLLASSLTMVAAMVAPLWVQPLSHVAWRSFAESKRLNTLLCAAAGFLTWVAALMLLSALAYVSAATAATVMPNPLAAVLLCASVALWRVSPPGIAAQYRCHRTYRLRPFAPEAQQDALLFGAKSAVACLRACAPAMLLPWFSQAPMTCMLLVTAIAFYDRTQFRPNHRLSAMCYAGLALLEFMP
jgi:Predicted metal-binding integral membrane protein (DUF2182)